MVSYDELKKARKTSGEILAEQKAHNPYGDGLACGRIIEFLA